MNEYHPEVHPVTTTTFIRNVSSPTTIVNHSEASALNLDPPPQSQVPGTYLGPNVQIGSGVTFNGNVYVQGNLIIGGTREHPVLTTTQ